MKKLGEIVGKDGYISIKVLKSNPDDSFVIQETDRAGKVINTVTLNSDEFDRLHQAMKEIKEY